MEVVHDVAAAFVATPDGGVEWLEPFRAAGLVEARPHPGGIVELRYRKAPQE